MRETTCPFCGAAVPHASRPVFAGAATRAAVFSALAGCWTGSAPEPQHVDDHPVDHTVARHEHDTPAPSTGTIEGTVTDTNTGGPATYAQVQLIDNTGRIVGSTTTQGDGRYRFASLPPGSYHVRVQARSNNPRMGGSMAEVLVAVSGDQTATADVQVAIPVYHYNPNQTPMPYGAPPARRRIV